MRLSIPCLLALSVVLAAGAAWAEPATHEYATCGREPSDADLTAAKAAFQAGNVSFNEADYPRALLYWEDAFRRDCTANPLLLNLARAYELNGQKRQAVVALEAFLAREPSSTEHAQITRRIEVLRKQIEQEDAQSRVATPAPPPAAAPAPATSPPLSSGPAPEPSKAMRVLPLVVAGVGGAVLLGGGVVYLRASAEVRRFERRCPKDPADGQFKCPDAFRGEIEPANEAVQRQSVSGAVALFVGLPLLAGGLVWYFAAAPSSDAPTALVIPAVAPGYAGLALDARF